MVSLPKKFRRNITVTVRSYVVIEPIPEGKKLRGEIVRILSEKVVKFLHKCGVWPQEFSDCIYLQEEPLDEVRYKLGYARSHDLLMSSSKGTKDIVDYASSDSEDDESDLEPNFNLRKANAFDSGDEESESDVSEKESDGSEEYNHLLLNPNQIKNCLIFVVKYIAKASIDFI